ncbi:MAG: tellurite resistance TerB family protein [Gemmatimonadota bacterium]|nr:tellurite resistance TerB family protein [Gemmatimonadota bacterium]
MTSNEAEAVVAIATLAALADGNNDAGEQAAIASIASRLGLSAEVIQRASTGQVTVAQLSGSLVSEESRQAAYDAALSVIHSDGEPSASERAFLTMLGNVLHISAENAVNPAAVTAMPPGAPGATLPSDMSTHILDQAILTAALEFLPDRLANMAILPLQMRLVYVIGQKHGQHLDAKQITDLAATFGIGAVAQVFEKIVRKTLGGITGGLLGGLLGGATGFAAGAAVTFASTYALGHAAEQYYAQNRSLSVTDMKTLFSRFQAEATEMYPRVQDRIQQRASGTNLSSVMQSIRG